MTVNEIINRLDQVDIKAERKSVYNDIQNLIDFGYDILCEKSRANKYFMASRDFEMPELKLLVDSVLAARFITEKKSKELVRKLELLASRHKANELNRNLIIGNRIKNQNENIYYHVDILNKTINEDKKVLFRYFDYDYEEGISYRHDGEIYEVSPYTLMWSEENYYLVAYHSRYEMISNFRVDRMDSISISDNLRYTKDIKLPFDEADNCKIIVMITHLEVICWLLSLFHKLLISADILFQTYLT